MSNKDVEKFIPPTAAESSRGNVWAQMERDGRAFEPLKAYQAFLIYCEMPAPRSIAEMVKNKLVNFDKRTLERYSAKYSWQNRAFAYDRYVAALEQNARDVARFNAQRKWTERREDLRQTEWTLGEKLIERANRLLDDTEIKGSLNDVVRCFDLADKLQRNAVDAETERIVITTPEQARHSDVMKARAAFARSAELFPHISEIERAEAIAFSYSVTVSEILAPEEILTGIVAEKVSGDLVN